MQEIRLNMAWLNDQLESLCESGEILEKALAFKSSLTNLLSNQLRRKQWKLPEFFILAIAFNLTEELCSNNKTVGSMYRHEWARSIGIKRPLMTSDIREIRNKYNRYYNQKIKLLKKLSQSSGMNRSAPPIAWLELTESIKSELYIQRHVTTYEMTNDTPPIGIECKKAGGMSELIRPEMAKLIRYNTFLLNEQDENTNDEFPYVYTLSELANRWQTNEQNVITACSKSDVFWPYLNISEGMHLHERTLPITTTMINENLRNGNLQADYKYGVKGYVRLTKKSSLPHKITLEYFQINKTIDPKTINAGKKYSPCIWIEPPFCKYILGIYQFIDVTRPINPTLFFLADEIHAFEKLNEFSIIFDKTNAALKKEICSPAVTDQVGKEPKEKRSKADNTPIEEVEKKLPLNEKKQSKFFKNGNCYEIHHEEQKLTLKASKGLGYLECIIKKIKQEIHVNELECIVNKITPPDQQVSLSEMEENHLNDASNVTPIDIVDTRALKEVNAALADVKDELASARETDDQERIEELEEAIEQYNQYLKGATGKHYQPRKVPDNDEKARKRVFSAIKDALKSIKFYSNPLYEHLTQSIKTGEFCIYNPTNPVEWV